LDEKKYSNRKLPLEKVISCLLYVGNLTVTAKIYGKILSATGIFQIMSKKGCAPFGGEI